MWFYKKMELYITYSFGDSFSLPSAQAEPPWEVYYMIPGEGRQYCVLSRDATCVFWVGVTAFSCEETVCLDTYGR